MKNIKVTIGISNSGKSTWTHEQWGLDKLGTLTVNRDKIRELLFGYTEKSVNTYYQDFENKVFNKLEKQVTKYEDLLIKEGLAENKTVIVDATHLKREYLVRYKKFNVPVELVFFDIDREVAIDRNSKRDRKVVQTVIKQQYQRYQSLKASLKDKPVDFSVKKLDLNPSLPKCILLDLDGTIAHMNGGRSPYDWKKVGQDSIDNNLYEVIACIGENNKWSGERVEVIICTGRDKICKIESKKWCIDNNIPFEEFHMRKENDMRPDWVVKEEMWRDIATRYNIVGLFDDRCQVVDRARSLGLKVFQVEYNNF